MSNEWLGRGIMLFENKDYSTALRAFERAIKTGEDSFKLYAYIAQCYLALSQFVEALEMIEEAILLSPLDSQGYVIKGKILINLGRYDEARKACNLALGRTINKQPGHAEELNRRLQNLGYLW